MKSQTKKVMRMVRFVEEMKLQRYPSAGSFSELIRKSDDRNDEFLAVSSKIYIKGIVKRIFSRIGAKAQRKDFGAPASCR